MVVPIGYAAITGFFISISSSLVCCATALDFFEFVREIRKQDPVILVQHREATATHNHVFHFILFLFFIKGVEIDPFVLT
jgi:hypothetical protein